MANKNQIVRVAMLKHESPWANKKDTLEFFSTITKTLDGKKVDVLITPECYLDGYMISPKRGTGVTREIIDENSVSGFGDPAIQQVCAIARRLKCYIVFGATERDGKDYRNCAYLIDRKGELTGKYYKVHSEVWNIPGDELPVFDTDFAKVGIVICADRRWPENMRVMRLKGAQIILNPTWGFHGDRNTAIMRTRAYENGLTVCFNHPLESLICTPKGEVGAFLLSNVPDILVQDVDLSENTPMLSTDKKTVKSPIQNRRPKLYGIIAEDIEKKI